MPQIAKQHNTKKPLKRTTAGAIDRLPSAWDLTEGYKFLIYGRSGTGKTVTWSSFPGPILAIICSGGMKPGELRSINTPEFRKKITPRIVSSSSDVRELVAEAKDYATVVLDHVTGLQDKVLAEILGLEELPTQKSWGLASQQQYGQCTLQVKGLLREMFGLDQHVVLVAQEREFNVDVENAELLVPYVAAGVTPSLVGWLNHSCDYVVQTFLRPKTVETSAKIAGKDVKQSKKVPGVDFCLRTLQHEVYTIKFRIPKGRQLPEYLVDPTFEKLQELIEGK